MPSATPSAMQSARPSSTLSVRLFVMSKISKPISDVKNGAIGIAINDIMGSAISYAIGITIASARASAAFIGIVAIVGRGIVGCML